MLGKFLVPLVAVGVVGASLPADALVLGHGRHHHRGIHRGGYSRVLINHSLVGRRDGFRDRRLAPVGVDAGYDTYFYDSFRLGRYGNPRYVWTPYGYRWVCNYDY